MRVVFSREMGTVFMCCIEDIRHISFFFWAWVEDR
jgi:hypothetical protein